jgi:hypothetical protein
LSPTPARREYISSDFIFLLISMVHIRRTPH